MAFLAAKSSSSTIYKKPASVPRPTREPKHVKNIMRAGVGQGQLFASWRGDNEVLDGSIDSLFHTSCFETTTTGAICTISPTFVFNFCFHEWTLHCSTSQLKLVTIPVNQASIACLQPGCAPCRPTRHITSFLYLHTVCITINHHYRTVHITSDSEFPAWYFLFCSNNHYTFVQ